MKGGYSLASVHIAGSEKATFVSEMNESVVRRPHAQFICREILKILASFVSYLGIRHEKLYVHSIESPPCSVGLPYIQLQNLIGFPIPVPRRLL
jgi:hypothetical protein